MDLVMIQGKYQQPLNLSHNVRQSHLLAWLLLKLEVCDLSGFLIRQNFLGIVLISISRIIKIIELSIGWNV